MGVKGRNLEINSGLLLTSFILNQMIIRVKEKSLNKEKQKEQKKEERNERGKEKNAEESKGFGGQLA